MFRLNYAAEGVCVSPTLAEFKFSVAATDFGHLEKKNDPKNTKWIIADTVFPHHHCSLPCVLFLLC